METEHTETVVDKAVAYVKDMFGIRPAPAVETELEHLDNAPEITAENAMRLDPSAYALSVGSLNAEGYVRPMEETETERLRGEADEQPRQKTALELNAESARAEDGG